MTSVGARSAFGVEHEVIKYTRAYGVNVAADKELTGRLKKKSMKKLPDTDLITLKPKKKVVAMDTVEKGSKLKAAHKAIRAANRKPYSNPITRPAHELRLSRALDLKESFGRKARKASKKKQAKMYAGAAQRAGVLGGQTYRRSS